MDERMDNEVNGQDTLKGVRIPNITRYFLFVVSCSGRLWLRCAKKERGGGQGALHFLDYISLWKCSKFMTGNFVWNDPSPICPVVHWRRFENVLVACLSSMSRLVVYFKSPSDPVKWNKALCVLVFWYTQCFFDAWTKLWTLIWDGFLHCSIVLKSNYK